MRLSIGKTRGTGHIGHVRQEAKGPLSIIRRPLR